MECRVCNSQELEPVIDLGMQPWCNNFLKAAEVGKEPFYPLKVVYCHSCRTAQLDYTVKKEIMFGNHTYLSGVTSSLSNHFQNIANSVDELFFKNESDKAVLDIGSNDGTQLKHFKNLGYQVLGVESSKTTAEIANQSGIETLNAFFNLEVAKSLKKKFQIVNASGVFFHLEELHSVTDGIREVLAANGVFVVQFLYMKNIVRNCAFDQIYHEHLLYYNLNTIEVLLNRHGLSMFDAYVAPIHGGSVIGFVSLQGTRKPSERLQGLRREETDGKWNEIATYTDFALRIEKMKRDNIEFLTKTKAEGKTVFGLGAPVKGNTLLNYFGVGTEYIDCLVERNPLRRDTYSPGTHIPVVIEDEFEKVPDIYYVLAWNFRDEILVRYEHLLKRGVEFYFPVNVREE